MALPLTTRSKDAVSSAVKTAAEFGNPAFEPIHLLDALLAESDGLLVPLLHAVGADPTAVRDQAQFPTVRFHDTRHTFASTLLSGGFSVAAAPTTWATPQPCS